MSENYGLSMPSDRNLLADARKIIDTARTIRHMDEVSC